MYFKTALSTLKATHANTLATKRLMVARVTLVEIIIMLITPLSTLSI